MPRVSYNYINNHDLYEAYVDWSSKGYPKPIPDYIVKSFMSITENLAKSGRFAGYSWKEDFIGDALLTCCEYADDFDPKRSKNPFAYITQMIFNSFRRRINIEHSNLAIKNKYKTENREIFDMINEELTGTCTNDQSESYNSIGEDAVNYGIGYEKEYKHISEKKREKALKKKNKEEKAEVADASLEEFYV